MQKRASTTLALIVVLVAILLVALLRSQSPTVHPAAPDVATDKGLAEEDLAPLTTVSESRQAATEAGPTRAKRKSPALDVPFEPHDHEQPITSSDGTGGRSEETARVMTDVPAPAHTRWIPVHLRDISVPTGGFEWEPRLTCLGDVDGDGKADIGLFVTRENLHLEVWILSPRDGTRLATFYPASSGHYWGSHQCRLLGLGDTNRDGRVEVATLTRVVTDAGACSSLLTLVRHGRSDPVWVQQISASRSLIGASLVRLPDLNHDGCPDLAVGVSSWGDEQARGYVEVRSGLDGALLTTIQGGSAQFHVGSELATVADADGDGQPDVLLPVLFHEFWETGYGKDDPLPRLETRSSVTGKLLRTTHLTGKPQWPFRRLAIRGGVDMDGDGSFDLVLRSWAETESVDVVSGTNGGVQRVEADPHAKAKDDPDGQAFELYDLDVLPDLDGDGWGECLIGQSFARDRSRWGSVGLFSTHGGEPIARIEGDRADGRFGMSVCWIGDSDGDGEPEFAVHATGKVMIFALRRVQ